MSVKPHTIDLVVDGKLLGMRQWHDVPRVGDLVLIHDNTATAKVIHVIWSKVGNDADIYDAWIQLVCKTVPHIIAEPKKRKSRSAAK